MLLDSPFEGGLSAALLFLLEINYYNTQKSFIDTLS